MKYEIHKAQTRGSGDYGWLKTNYYFSFANYYNPSRMGFGALRVINDDWIASKGGFPAHSHNNMEIVTIPFSGKLEHQDSIGNKGIVSTGEIQVMSAGSGVTHAEFNASETEPLTLFQIWITSNAKDVEPRYDQKPIDTTPGAFRLLVDPKGSPAPVFVHQSTWIHQGIFAIGDVPYRIKTAGNGAYVVVLEGKVTFDSNELGARDAAAFSDTTEITLSVLEGNTKILIIEIPL